MTTIRALLILAREWWLMSAIAGVVSLALLGNWIGTAINALDDEAAPRVSTTPLPTPQFGCRKDDFEW